MTAKSPYPVDDVRQLRKLLRDARKLAKRIGRSIDDAVIPVTAEPPWSPPVAEPEPPAPRWLLNGEQLRAIANRLNLAVPGTYGETAAALGIEGDLYQMIDETWAAARRLGVCRVRPGTGQDKGEWLESYRDARHAYAWHLAVAHDHAPTPNSEGDTDG